MWGTGTSLGFPMGMSAGADEPALAASRVGVITTIGYSAFLAGPPLIGFLGQRFSVPHALLAVIAVLIVAGLVAGSVRPRGVADRTDVQLAFGPKPAQLLCRRDGVEKANSS